jgi:hypothetical protein
MMRAANKIVLFESDSKMNSLQIEQNHAAMHSLGIHS